VPEASLAMNYSYLNPSTDARGRRMQSGDIQFSSKNYPEAENVYRALIAESPNDEEAWSSLGFALRAQDKHGAAAEAFAKSVENAKDDHMSGRTWYTVAVEYAKAGSKDAAVGALEKAFAHGYQDRNLGDEPALTSLVSDPRVRQLVAKK